MKEKMKEAWEWFTDPATPSWQQALACGAAIVVVGLISNFVIWVAN